MNADYENRPLLVDRLETLLRSGGQSCVPGQPLVTPPEHADIGAVHDELCSVLADCRARAKQDPFANPVEMLALAITRRIDGGRMSWSVAEQLVQKLTAGAYVDRAARLRDYLGEVDPDAVAVRIAGRIDALARPESEPEGLVPFETFRDRVERELFGIVITAHPTFALSADLIRTLAKLATDRDEAGAPLDDAARYALLRRALESEHRPDAPLNLEAEHRLSLEVTANLRAALCRLYEIVLETAEKLYPERWTELNPRLVTVATWVGYDLDGRADIPWSESLFARLTVQAVQMHRYRKAIADIRDRYAADPAAIDLRHTLELVESRLSLALREVEDEIAAFKAQEETPQAWQERVRAIAKRMQEGRDLRLIEAEPLIERIERAIGLTPEPEGKRALCVLRAELAGHGLSLAHTHVRLNATQIHNAARRLIGIEGSPDDPSRRRAFLGAIGELIETVEPVTINFGSMLTEQASANRLFMLVAQFLKYVDATTPVRFLIAECESPFTLLAALYYARLFGIERHIDISPLFETVHAFERGTEVIEGALANAHYRAYIRARGRLCIQTGYSDAGRYLGQITAAIAIERLKVRVGATLARLGLDDVDLVVFDTHGDSIGRGGHPGRFDDRLQYIAPPAARIAVAANGVELKQEASFQGGDGWVYFMTETAAFASIGRIIDHALGALPTETDPFYADADYVTEFATTVRRFNQRLMADPAYPILLDAFGTNLIHPSGSRATKRQTDAGGHVELTDPTQLRAIPHNAVLQQMGLLANTLGGLGQAIRNDPETFHTLLRESARFRRLLAMAAHARLVSDPDSLAAAMDTIDPGHWLLRAAESEDEQRFEALKRVAAFLEDDRRHEPLAGLFRRLLKDWLDLDRHLAPHPDLARRPARDRDTLQILQALRLVLIERIFLLATHIPDFRPQHGTSYEQVVGQILHLDIPEALRVLDLVFPRTDPNVDLDIDDFGEPATYESESAQSYEREHERIFRPMGESYALIRRIGTALIHIAGATG